MIRRLFARLFRRRAPGGAVAEPTAPSKSQFTAGAPPRRRGRHEPNTYRGSEQGMRIEDLSPAAIKTCEGLRQGGYLAYIVGGGVRDLLLNLHPKDFDVATNATPEQVTRLFRRSRVIGRRFQIVHVMFGRETIEVTTFRALQNDAETDEHGRVLRDNVWGTIEDDATRRDFTINALYYDPTTDTLLDYHHGVEDLRAKTLRMIGDPVTRYREDPVRMLRSARFAAKLGFVIEEKTRKPIRELASLIHNVPAARLFDEMLKLLESGHALQSLHQLRAEGLSHGLLPLLDIIIEQPDGERFIHAALSRTDERVLAGKSISPGFLFATLLWPQVRLRWEQRLSSGEHQIPALLAAVDSVVDEQCENLAIQKRIAADMREIWSLQPRFDRRQGRSPSRLIEHLRFRAGYDFLMLRCDTGEIPAELGEWWTRYIDADSQEREDMLSTAPSGSAAARKRRRRKPRGGASQSDGSSGGESPGGNAG